MTKEQIAEKLRLIHRESVYSGELSRYAVRSIREGRSSYPVSNLLNYCEGSGIQMVMMDSTTDEIYPVDEIMEVHELIRFLMDRYETDAQYVYRKTGIHYTEPKFGRAHLSINTLLAVCSSLHCWIDFLRRDESSVIIPENYGNKKRTT